MHTLFISCVSNEFGNYREAIRKDFSRPNLETKIQEDFAGFAGSTLEKLDDYIKGCSAIIHIVGDMMGSMANQRSIEFIKGKYTDFGQRIPCLQPVLNGKIELSYTLWEAYLAVYHGKRLFIAKPGKKAIRSEKYVKDDSQIAIQINHLQWLEQLGYYADIEFENENELAKRLYQSNLGDILYSIPGVKPINLPYLSIGENFKGREDFIKNDLRPAFEKIKPGVTAIVMHGLGGVGKTRLAVEYALQYQNDYTALLFINADQPSAFQTNVANLTGLLELKEKEEKEEEVKYNAVVKWLNSYKGWLLIMDNVDSNEAKERVKDFLRKLQHGNVLITSRISQWGRAIEAIELGTLSMEASLAFLIETTENRRVEKPNDGEIAALVVADLGYLALALEQARAYIERMVISLEAYHKIWHTKRSKVMGWFDESLMEYDRSVAITWETSFDKLSQDAKTLLNRLAWFAPDPIPKYILEAEVEGVPQIDALSAWAELKQFSLSASTADKTAFIIHRLVQEVTRNRMDEQIIESSLKETLFWMDATFVGSIDDVLIWPVLEPLVPHILSIFEFSPDDEACKAFTPLMNNVASLFFKKAQYSQAEPLMIRGLSIDEQSYGSNHPNVAIRLNNLAQLLQATNRLTDAEPLMKRALEIDEASFGSNHPNVARDLNNLALLLKATNRHAEAEPLMNRALAIDEENFGSNHPNVATRLGNLAQLLSITNRLSEAEPLMKRALAIDEQSYGSNHPNVATDLNNLASLFQATNRLEEAEPLMKRALEIDEQSYGSNHPKVATMLNNLAQLLHATNRLTDAEPLMKRALEIDEASFGSNHPHVAIDLNNLAQLLADANRLDEAEPLMKRALEIDEQSLGSNHPNVARDLNNIASLLQATNRLSEAVPLMERALAIDEQSFGSNHPNIAIRLNNLTQMLQATNRFDEAEPLMKRALEIDEKSFGINHPKVAIRLNNLALLYKATNRLTKAEPLMRLALIIFAIGLGFEHPNTESVFNNYLILMQEMGKTEEEIKVIIQELFA